MAASLEQPSVQTASVAEAPYRISGKPYAFLIAFVSAVGGFLFGYDLAIMGGANLYLREQFGLSPAVFGFTSASAGLGCIVGPFFGGWFCDRIGRRNTLIVACVLLGVGSLFTAIPNDLTTFNIFRIVGGLGVGLCSIASPMYTNELCRPAGAAGWGSCTSWPSSSVRSWRCRGMAVGQVVGPRYSCAGCSARSWCLSPFSPCCCSWCRKARGGWRNGEKPPQPRPSSRASTAPSSPARKSRRSRSRWPPRPVRGTNCGCRAWRKALFVGLCLALFNNYTGWSAIGGYLVLLFEMGGLSRTDAIFQFVLAYGFMGLMTLLACGVVDRAGRRPLWIVSSLVMIGANGLLGAVFHCNVTGILVLVAVFLCAIPHSFALGPLPWLMMSEIFPTRIRAVPWPSPPRSSG